MSIKRLLHLSDLHFGTIDPQLPQLIHQFVERSRSSEPIDLVVISGDLTQRARTSQFQQASQFIYQLNVPCVVIPGNHDIPLYNFLQRWLMPLRKFNQNIDLNLSEYHDDFMDAVGIHTTNRFSVKDGRYSSRLWKGIEQKFDSEKWRILALHHPPKDFDHSQRFKEHIELIKPHLILSGHYHQSGAQWHNDEKKTVEVSAGTATSTRTREEKNSFNLITLGTENKKRWLECATFVIDNFQFFKKESQLFRLEDDLP